MIGGSTPNIDRIAKEGIAIAPEIASYQAWVRAQTSAAWLWLHSVTADRL